MNAVDTNILIYAYDDRDSKRKVIASELIESESMLGGVLLWQVACEFIASSQRLMPKVQSFDLAWQRLKEIRGLFHLVLPTASMVDIARNLMNQHQLSFWDAMIYAACIDAGIDVFYSEDLPGERIEGLRIVNPFAVSS